VNYFEGVKKAKKVLLSLLVRTKASSSSNTVLPVQRAKAGSGKVISKHPLKMFFKRDSDLVNISQNQVILLNK
jgi:hypothetical protein